MKFPAATLQRYVILTLLVFVPLIAGNWHKLSNPYFLWDGNQRRNLDEPLQAWTFHIDINSATASEWMMLENIGPAMAQKILEVRQQLPGRRFQTIEQLLDVKGLGPKTLDKIKPFVICED